MKLKISELSPIDGFSLHVDIYSFIHSGINLYRVDVFRVHLFFASLPAAAQIYEFAINDYFRFKPCAWFPLVVMLNIFFPIEDIKPDMSTIGRVFLPLLAMLNFTLLCLIFFVYKLVVYTIESKLGDNLYFLVMLVANGHALVTLFLIGLKRPVELVKVKNDEATGFKSQVTYVLLFSTFMTSDGAEQSSELTLFRSFGMLIIILVCVLPWLTIEWKLRTRILNLFSTYFFAFLLVIGLKDFLLGSVMLIGLRRFILFCSFFVFCYWNSHHEEIEEEDSKPIGNPDKVNVQLDPALFSSALTSPQNIALQNTRSWESCSSDLITEDISPAIGEEEKLGEIVQESQPIGFPDKEEKDMASDGDPLFEESETQHVKIAEKESQPIGFPDKMNVLLGPVLVPSEPTSPWSIALQSTRTMGSCSSSFVSDVNRPAIAREEEEANHEADLLPMNMAGYMTSCISYCSLFPADYEFARDTMVWSWMASEIIKPDNIDEMEEVAIKCFDTLVARGCIVLSGYDRSSDRWMYKLEKTNDVFLDEQHLQLQYRRNLDDNTNLQELVHLSLISKEINQQHFEILKKCNNLKTLILHKCNMLKLEKSLYGLFLKQELLTTLDLSFTNIAELPSSVEKLSSLKCLDLSWTPIRWLPVSIESLSNLETLILLGCRSLHALPRGMSKLTNLQNLSLDIRLQLNAMPTGIGRLTKLQSLRVFPVGKNDGNRIGELRGMNKLKGSIVVCKLENILTEEEAKMTLLSDKQLTELEFLWSDLQDSKVTIEEGILENLQPHFGLQKLKIGFFSGGVLPPWISNPRFEQMTSITLSWCRYCEKLPTLGELPSLKFLRIFEMNAVADIDISFCRNLESKPAFPKLEELSIEGMPNLEKWSKVGGCDFATLVHLGIKYCPKLTSLPHFSNLDTLQHLEISYCGELACLPKPKRLVKNLVVKECSKLSLD